MKRLILFVVLILCAIILSGQTFVQQVVARRNTNFTSAVAGAAFETHGLGYGTYQVKYEVFNGTLSACTFQFEGSPDNVTYTLVYGPVTCTTDGITTTITAGSGGTYSSWVRVNTTTLTKSSANTQLNTTILAYQ